MANSSSIQLIAGALLPELPQQRAATNTNGTDMPPWSTLFFAVSAWLLIGWPSVLIGGPSDVATPANEAAEAMFFREHVEPLLRRHCYACHSHAAQQIESGLALDWRSGWERGGERGPAIVPGNPAASLLIRAIEHRDSDLKMPEEQLPAAAIATLTEWVRRGAFDDRIATPKPENQRDWWSLRPLVSPPLPTLIGKRLDSRNPIDEFIASGHRANGLTASPLATPRERIRRLYFDLHGLPPSAAVVDKFSADPSPAAYAAIVDELLASPRYGERWARHWFDTIHFADSHGTEHDVGRDHAWPYRDYVIQAFNADLSWAQFIREQLAVDHFSPEASERFPALGFLGAGTFDISAYATAPMTFDYLDRDDLVTQTMSAFVSTTANCARCHHHKFDPITQEDYYALQAVFSGMVKGDIPYDADPKVAAQRRDLLALKAAAVRRDAAVLQTSRWTRRVAEWSQQRGADVAWQPVTLQSFTSQEGATLTLRPEGFLLASGKAAETDTYQINVTTSLPQITALRLDLFPHESLPAHGPGRCHNGNLHLSEVTITSTSPGAQAGVPIKIAAATADFNQEGWSIERSIDGVPGTAWGIYPAVGVPHHAVFTLAEPLTLAPDTVLTVALKQLHGGSHLIGAFRLSVSDQPADKVAALPSDIEQVLQTPAVDRTPDQQLALAAHVALADVASELAKLPAPGAVYAAGKSVAIPMGNGDYQAASIPTPKVVHLLYRGELTQPRSPIGPGALSALTPLDARFDQIAEQGDAARRAALADWLAHPENPLTWRSVVNRVWHYHFGRGLCDTPSDFGRMGGLPSHPELIDWLAVWFRDEAGGSLKQLHRLIVLSEAYQQSAELRPEAIAVDADNRWLWRQNRLRLDADAYRDAVLAVSGRLDLTMGGPANAHFQKLQGIQRTPKLDYTSFDWNSPGANRRSIYRYVWRGIPDPLLSALDFPDLGLLAPTRTNSASPLQALALYNNPFVLFHAQAMADQLERQHSNDLDQQVRELVLTAYQRPPTPTEQPRLRRYAEQHGLAALCRLLLNSSEFLFVP